MLGDVIGQWVGEVFLLGLGKAVAAVCLPGYEWEDARRLRTQPRGAGAGFSYERNGKRCLYLESLQLLGLAALVVLGLLVFGAWYLSST